MAARPFNEKDLITQTNGDPIFLGALVSTGAAVNNSTTATPFATTPLGPPPGSVASPQNLTGTLAGKTLLIQPLAAGSIITSNSANMTINAVPGASPIIAQQTVLPPLAGTTPGVGLIANERVELIMMPLNGWIQWLPTSGPGNCLVFELR